MRRLVMPASCVLTSMLLAVGCSALLTGLVYWLVIWMLATSGQDPDRMPRPLIAVWGWISAVGLPYGAAAAVAWGMAAGRAVGAAADLGSIIGWACLAPTLEWAGSRSLVPSSVPLFIMLLFPALPATIAGAVAGGIAGRPVALPFTRACVPGFVTAVAGGLGVTLTFTLARVPDFLVEVTVAFLPGALAAGLLGGLVGLAASRACRG